MKEKNTQKMTLADLSLEQKQRRTKDIITTVSACCILLMAIFTIALIVKMFISPVKMSGEISCDSGDVELEYVYNNTEHTDGRYIVKHITNLKCTASGNSEMPYILAYRLMMG